MSELPNGWVNATLDDLGNWSSGGTPSRSRADYFDGDISFVKTGDLEDGWLEEIPERISEAGLQNSSAKLFPKGTLLIAMYGATIGKTARLSVDAATNQACAALLGNEANHESLDYVWAYLRSQLDNFRAAGKGGAQPNISQTFLKSYPIPLPPVPEQRRIVKKLDTLSARTATARIDLTAVTTLVERYKLSVLGSLFGKSGLGPKPTDELWSIPEQWDWMQVKDIGEVGLGRQRSPENHQGPSMRPYIRAANITWSGVDTSDVKEMNFDAADFERFELKDGDVLLNEGSGSAKEVGKPAIWQSEISGCCFQNTVLRVQPKLCSSEFLYWYFLLTALSEGFVKDTKGVNIQHIGKRGLSNFPIPVPPRSEQDEIVHQIEMTFQKIDRLATEAAKALKLTDNLDQRILAKAFSGQLVPQDPTDEPASALLARIQEARANAPKKPRKKPTKAKRMKVAPQERVLTDSVEWPETGLPFEDVANRITLPHDELKDAIFALLEGDTPKLRQEFDTDAQIMKLIRVAS